MTNSAGSVDRSKPLPVRVDYSALGIEELRSNARTAVSAYRHFYDLWQQTVEAHFGTQARQEYTAEAYPGLAAADGDVVRMFYASLTEMNSAITHGPGLLTFASLEGTALPTVLEAGCIDKIDDVKDLLLLWNLCTLTYVMQSASWTQVLTQHVGKSLALAINDEVWVARGAAEDDLRYGLEAAGALTGDVRTLFEGFQFAPGEVGLVDAEFHLDDDSHGRIIHRVCPAHDVFRDTDRERLENSCVICVKAMRLSGEMVNPNMRCQPASLPPHRSRTDHACMWDYWIEDAG